MLDSPFDAFGAFGSPFGRRRRSVGVASLSHAAMSTATITEVATADGSDLSVTWADGYSETIASGGGSSRTYGGATAGNVVISASAAITRIDLQGSGEVWDFALSSLPTGLTYFLCYGSNTVTGDIASLPTGLTYFLCTGSNTVTGDIASLPTGLTYFRCDGSNTVTTTSGASLPQSSLRYMQIEGAGLTSGEVDDILIACAGVGTWTNEKTVNFAGANAARTSASDSAVSTLTGIGVTVTTN